jgi:hypothetical protein
MTREAISRRLGTLVAPPGSGWKARYTSGHAPEGSPRDFVRLELFGPDGGLQLLRDLPLEGSCATMADVIALVLDRHFRGLRHAEPEPSPPAIPDLPPEPEHALPTSVRVPALGNERLLLLGLELAVQYPLASAAGLRVLGEVADNFYVGAAISTALTPREERLGRGGEVALRGATLHGHGGWGPTLGPVHTYLGPGFRLTLDRGSARDLPDVDTRYRAVWGAGAHAGLVGPVSEHLSLTISGAVDWTLRELGGRFAVDGVEVLRPSGVEAWVGVGLGHAL